MIAADSETTAREFIMTLQSKLKNIPQTYLDACMDLLERFEEINRDSKYLNQNELRKHIHMFQSEGKYNFEFIFLLLDIKVRGSPCILV